MSAEDIYRLIYVDDAQTSPDGRWVAYVLRTCDRSRDRNISAIWLAPFSGGASHPLTSGEHRDASPTWSPDSRHIAFISDRSGSADLYLTDLADAEPRQLTRGFDVLQMTWSPDGRQACFVARNPLDAGAEGRPRVVEVLDYKTTLKVELRRRQLWLLSVDRGEPRALTDGRWDDSEPAWAPDGKQLAFVSNRTGDPRTTLLDIWLIGADGASAKRLTAADGVYYAPAFSPSGETIAYFGVKDASENLAELASNFHVWVQPIAAGPSRDVLADWDRTAGNFNITAETRSPRGGFSSGTPIWSPDESTIFFLGTDRGSVNVFAVPSGGGIPQPVSNGTHGGKHDVAGVSFDAARRQFAGVVSAPTQPDEVYVGNVGGAMRPLTEVNRRFAAEVYISPVEPFTFEGKDGVDLDGWLLKPPGFDPKRRYPLVLRMHGGPHNSYGYSFLYEMQVLTSQGYVVAYGNPRGSHGYGQAFSLRLMGDWGGIDFEDYMAEVDHVVARGFSDEKRIGLVGGSSSGYLVNWMVGHTNRFAAAVTQRSIASWLSEFGTSDRGWFNVPRILGGTMPWEDPALYVRQSPITYADKVTTPLLILHGEADTICPIEQVEQFYAALKYLGKTVRFVRYPGEPHWMMRGGRPSNRVHHMQSVVDWFAQYLGTSMAD